jgi:hypothetical protein
MKVTLTLFVLAALAALAAVLCGCSTLDKLYSRQVTTNTVATVSPVTNAVTVTNTVTQTFTLTNGVTQTNVVAVVVTNTFLAWQTNIATVTVTNLVDSPAAETTVTAVGGVVNTFLPGVGSLVALLAGGAYHIYRQARNKQVNAALAQGVETAREILTTTPQGEALDAQLVRWLQKNQAAAGVLGTVSGLVASTVDNDAAKEAAETILARVQSSKTTPTA